MKNIIRIKPHHFVDIITSFGAGNTFVPHLYGREFCERLRDSSGDITDIYQEIPAKLTAERAHKLKAGIKKFLE